LENSELITTEFLWDPMTRKHSFAEVDDTGTRETMEFVYFRISSIVVSDEEEPFAMGFE
jgi:hypothetical protein